MAERQQRAPRDVERAELLQHIVREGLEGWTLSKNNASSHGPHPKPEFLQVALDAARELYGAHNRGA